MPDSVNEFTDRRERRFGLGNSDLTVKITRLATKDRQQNNEVVNALPQDVSLNGLKLMSPCPLLFEELVGLEFHSQSADVKFKAVAEVRWIRQDEDNEDQWIIGCRITDGMPEESLDKLSNVGGIERRRISRTKTKLEAELQLPTTSERHPISIVDFSGQGLRFCTEIQIQGKQPVKVYLKNELGNELEVVCKTRWSQAYESGYFVGCEVSNGCQTKFRRWIEWLAESAHVDRRHPVVWLAWTAAAVASVLIWVL